MKKIIGGLIFLVLGFSCFLWGQSGLGSITGTVVDPSGAVILDAAVELKSTSTQGIRSTATNEVGLFTLPSITPGKYVIRITASGFKEKTLENLNVNAFQQIALGQIALEVGQGAQVTVTVTAEQQLVKDSAVRYDTVQAKMVSDMPLFGRNWTGLLKAIPGGNPTASTGFNGREYGYYGYTGQQRSKLYPPVGGEQCGIGSMEQHGSFMEYRISGVLRGEQQIRRSMLL